VNGTLNEIENPAKKPGAPAGGTPVLTPLEELRQLKAQKMGWT
jgi:hypothetical protein